MNTICGANCEACGFKENCAGCAATCGQPFGGSCVAAAYIKTCGKEAYAAFKRNLLTEVNALLAANGIPAAEALHELPGWFVNLAYPLPSGEAVRFLDDKKVYLGAQILCGDSETCCGVIADTGFILICRYGDGGASPELIVYRERTEENA